MRLRAAIRSFLRSFFNRERIEGEMDSELEFHIDSYAEDLIRAGIPQREAIRRARVEFGAVEAHKEEMRASLGLRAWDEIRADFRYAARRMKKSPGFTILAIFVIAVGVGVNVAAFNQFNLMVLKPLPLRDPDSLIRLQRRSPAGSANLMPYPTVLFYGRHTRTLSAVMATMDARLDLESDAQPVTVTFATANYFTELGIPAECGRLLDSEADDRPGAVPVAVLSFELWQRRFGADPSIVGRTIHLNRQPVTVIGITRYASASLGNQHPGIWLPIGQQPHYFPGSTALTDTTPAGGAVAMWARLAPGVSARSAEQELLALTDQLRREDPKDIWDHEFIRSEPSGYLHASDPETYLALGAFGALTLLILVVACANLGALLLARGLTREREIRTRLALGAGPLRMFRQLFTENALLALVGSAAGLGIGYIAFRIMLTVEGAPKWATAIPDWRVCLFTTGLSLVVATFFGLPPALQISYRQHRKTRWRTALVSAQVAASCALLILAGLLVRATRHALYTYPGFGYEQVLSIDLSLDQHGYKPAAARAYLDQFTGRLRAVPGVTAAAISSMPPLGHDRISTITADLAGRPAEIHPYTIDPGFFHVMSIPLLHGRNLLPGETNAIVVSESLARRQWPGQDPIGKLWNQDVVVGVAGNAPMNAQNYSNAMELYRSAALADLPGMVVVVKIVGTDEPVVSAAKAAAGNLDPHVFPEVHELKTDFRRNIQPAQLAAILVSFLGAVAMLLASLGLGGLVSYSVSERTKEIAIRIALGAKRRQVLLDVLCQFASPVSVGLLIGLAGTATVSQFLRMLLFGLSNFDAASYLGAVGVLLVTSTLAALVPARRTFRLDPMRALHHD